MLEIKDSEIIKPETWQEKEAYAIMVALNNAEHPVEAYEVVYEALGRAYNRGKQGDERP